MGNFFYQEKLEKENEELKQEVEKAKRMKKDFLETLARNIAAWQTSKDKKEGLLPEVYLHDTYLFEKMTGLNPNVWSNLQKHAPGLGDRGVW